MAMTLREMWMMTFTMISTQRNHSICSKRQFHVDIFQLNKRKQNKKPEGFMQSCTLFKQVKSHISHFLMRSMGAAILEKLSLIYETLFKRVKWKNSL